MPLEFSPAVDLVIRLADAEVLCRLSGVGTELLRADREPGRRRPDDAVLARQQASRGEMEKTGQQFPLGQVAGGAEQRDDVVIRAVNAAVNRFMASSGDDVLAGGACCHDVLESGGGALRLGGGWSSLGSVRSLSGSAPGARRRCRLALSIVWRRPGLRGSTHRRRAAWPADP